MLYGVDDAYFIYSGATAFILGLMFFVGISNNRRHKLILGFLLVSLFSLIVGLRDFSVGNDTDNYVKFFQGHIVVGVDEPFWAFFNRLVGSIVPEATIFLILSSLVTNLFLLFAYRKFDHNYIVYFAIFSIFFLFINMNVNIMRQALAISFFAFSAFALVRKDFLSYWLFACLSFLTHYSAFPIFILYLLTIFNKRFIMLILSLLAISLYFINIADIILPFVQYNSAVEKAYWYLTWDKANPWKIKHIYFIAITFSVAFIFLYTISRRFRANVENSILDINNFLLLGLVLVVLFKSEEMIADRVFYYFIVFAPVLLLWLFSHIKPFVFTHLIMFFGLVFWWAKSYLVQYHSWFVLGTSIR